MFLQIFDAASSKQIVFHGVPKSMLLEPINKLFYLNMVRFNASIFE